VKWLAARAAALPPRLQDLILALALAAVNVGTVVPYRGQLHPLAGVLALLVSQAVPLIWRRSWPIGVFAAVGISRVLYDQLGYHFAPVPLGPAIAYYTVMERCSTRTRWVLSAILLTGMLISQSAPGHNEPYDFFVVVLIFVAAGTAGILSRALSRTRRAYLDEVEARAARAQSQRDQEVALAAARERTRIARELHDVVAHHVSLMAVQAEAADSLLPGHPAEAARSVQIIGNTGRQALGELRRLLGVLRGPGEQPQTGPSPSLEDLGSVLAQVREAGLEVDLTIEGSPVEIAPGVGLTAYRIVQEALTNALRHSAATRAAVTVRYEPGYVTVSVTNSGGVPSDNGDAWVPVIPVPVIPAPVVSAPAVMSVTATLPAARSASDRASGGFGLAGIVERVASCGGSLTVGPTSAGGFAVTARLPTL
jgi:signal transduction histidine kinase